ncbi:hypothetical protein M378DRAFT_9473 [Amanita muscaria Koide BX008]|uniref:Uncharacterized protein n=1 Tax=Amanita muscaria (strain Koide BX008) TaxID=946122 RepID=A0A0C2WZG0_AMAMK|nr:hypothetical protein M378DRAFT_9473 [Amanita muscaria Koide BX008]
MTMDSSSTRTVSRRAHSTTLDNPWSLIDSDANGKSMGELFRSLPVEIQTEIFVFAVNPLTCLSTHSLPQPTILSQVCKTWKTLATSTPHIWSSFAFELPREADLTVSRQRQIVNRMQYWLERSCHHPLDFTLTQQRSVRNRNQPEHAEILLLTLLSHSSRWHHVRVSIWNDDLANAFNDRGNRFPLLRSLTIDPTISKTRSPFSFKSLEGSWLQLSTVHLVNYRQPPPIDQALRILTSAPNIESFTANLLCDSVSRKYEEGDIRLPNLTHMHLIFQYVDGIPRPKAVFEDVMRNCLSFLTSLSMNALRSFSLEWDIECTDHSCIQLGSTASETLVVFLRTIGLTLQELSFLYLPIDDGTLLDCLAHTPFLKYLQLKYSLVDDEPTPVNDKFLGGLTLPDSSRQEHSTVPLPLLATVKLETCGISLTAERLARFVRSRMDGHDLRIGRLERLELLTQRPLYVQYPPELTEFTHRLDIFSRIARGPVLVS